MAELEGWLDYELEKAGRLTVPLRWNAETDKYEPVGRAVPRFARACETRVEAVAVGACYHRGHRQGGARLHAASSVGQLGRRLCAGPARDRTTWPATFKNFDERLFTPGGIERPLAARERKWNTRTGKANFKTPTRLFGGAREQASG